MKIALRADASIDIGTGHVMRCLALADRLREQGDTTRFLCRPLAGHLGEAIRAHGHELIWVEADHPQEDARTSLTALQDNAPWDWLVVDHYGLDAAWEQALRAVAKRILVIDDLADRPHDCDLLLDQNFHPQPSERYAGLVPAGCELLLGPRYALLRPQFAQARQRLRTRSGEVRRLLICFGGSDPQGATRLALEAVRRLDRPDLMVDVVVGAANPHRAAIEAACQGLPQARLHYAVEDMAALMSAADLFIGSGGSITWERCCLGLPGVVLACADNQVAMAEALQRAGAQAYLGKASEVSVHEWLQALRGFMQHPDSLQGMSERGLGLVDGCGVGRVIEALTA